MNHIGVCHVTADFLFIELNLPSLWGKWHSLTYHRHMFFKHPFSFNFWIQNQSCLKTSKRQKHCAPRLKRSWMLNPFLVSICSSFHNWIQMNTFPLFRSNLSSCILSIGSFILWSCSYAISMKKKMWFMEEFLGPKTCHKSIIFVLDCLRGIFHIGLFI